MTKLILIRHGETNWNVEKRYAGFTDVPLNERGIKQAKLLHKRFRKEPIHKIYTSDRKRAIQTAKIIFKRKLLIKIPNLRELHFGCLEGFTYKEIMQKHPEVYKKWLHNPFKTTIPKGENLIGFQKRVTQSIKKIASSNKNKTIAVVCHGGTISIFITYILKSKKFWNHIPNSTSVTIIEYTNNKPKIKLFNDTRHLEIKEDIV